MSESSKLRESLFETMSIFSKNAIRNSNATLTIEAKVKDIIDAGLGRHYVEYMGNTLEAHSNGDATYSIGENVYVLIPDGKFDKEKIILGTVRATSGISDATEDGIDSKYREVSENLIDKSFNTIGLISYRTTMVEDADIVINEQRREIFGSLLKDYLQNYRTFAFGFNVETNLPFEQQNSGNYGVILKIPLVLIDEEDSAETYWEEIQLDINDMVGNPYKYSTATPQTIYYTIDSKYTYNEKELPKISYFCKDFKQDPTKTQEDIWLSNISFKIIEEIGSEKLKGYSLTLKASEGDYFSKYYKTTKVITPTLKLNGNITSLKDAEIYWFKEDNSIKIGVDGYHVYGGNGWKCINDKHQVGNNLEYYSNRQEQIVTQKDVGISARYKCVVIYNNEVITATIFLKNLNITNFVKLDTADDSNVYTKENKDVNFYVKIYLENVTVNDDAAEQIKFYLNRKDKDGKDIEDDENFFNCEIYHKVEEIVLNNKKYSCYVSKINFNGEDIEDFNTIYCEAKYITVQNGKINEQYLGSDSMMVITSNDLSFDLNINNSGSYLYQYDNNRMLISYTGSRNSLTYTLKNNSKKKEFTEDEYNNVKYCWVTNNNSLFNMLNPTSADTENYYFEGYGNKNSLFYTIQNNYDNIKKFNNQIKLIIEYQGVKITKNIDFEFEQNTADNDITINSFNYDAKLIAGGTTAADSAPFGEYNNDTLPKLRYIYDIHDSIFKDIELNQITDWKNSNYLIYPKVTENGIELSPDKYDIEYSMFDSEVTKPCFDVERAYEKNNGALTTNLRKDKSAYIYKKIENIDANEVYCNIIQAKITVHNQSSIADQDEIIYAYYPIELTFVGDDTIRLSPDIRDGFFEVKYAIDGTNPTYNITNFFSIFDSHIQAKEFTKYFNINWETSKHFTSTVNEDALCELKADNKYDDGDSKNYIKVKISFNKDKEDLLKNEISELIVSNNVKNNSIEEYNKMQNYLEEFANEYKFDKWIQNINDISQYTTIGNEIEFMSLKIPNDAKLRFRNLRNICQFYAEELKKATSADIGKKLLKELYANAIKGSFEYIDGELRLIEYLQNIVIAQSVNDLEILTKENTEKINMYENILENKDIEIMHIRPIVFYFNRKEMNNIKAWDGNKIGINQKDSSYLLTPQAGFGKKEEDDSFSGLVMSMKNTDGNITKGLFGYKNGDQTVFLDAEKGSILIGKSDTGQIAVDPVTGNTLLFSNNYFKSYNEDGLPINYNDDNINTQEAGLMINLSTSEIKYSNGRFKVDKDGKLTSDSIKEVTAIKDEDIINLFK